MQRILHLAVSLAFHAYQQLKRGVHELLGLPIPGTCVVLYYHEIRHKDRQRFARQMDALVRLAEPTTSDRRQPLLAGRHYAAVTFDDGFRNVVENGLPELRKRRIPSTLFIITEALGGFPTWLSRADEAARQQPILSEDELQALPTDLVAIGSHTMTHPWLSELSDSDARREITQSRAKLEQILGRPVTEFSFPYGCMNTALVAVCRQAGYDRVFSTSHAPAFHDPDEFVTGRVSVEPTDWPIEFRLKVMGAYCWRPAAVSLKRRVRSALALQRA